MTPDQFRLEIAALTRQRVGRPLGRALGRPAGWIGYPPGSAPRPTVSLGRALVLYLLPAGAIQFTPSA